MCSSRMYVSFASVSKRNSGMAYWTNVKKVVEQKENNDNDNENENENENDNNNNNNFIWVSNHSSRARVLY